MFLFGWADNGERFLVMACIEGEEKASGGLGHLRRSDEGNAVGDDPEFFRVGFGRGYAPGFENGDEVAIEQACLERPEGLHHFMCGGNQIPVV